jgi:hypothetical protein
MLSPFPTPRRQDEVPANWFPATPQIFNHPTLGHMSKSDIIGRNSVIFLVKMQLVRCGKNSAMRRKP